MWQVMENPVEKKGTKVTKMGSDEFLRWCKKEVADYFNTNADKTDNKRISEEDVFIVWYCKTLQNHKCLASTDVPDGMYYELTFNGDSGLLYFDAYKKWKNVVIGVEW